MTTLIGKLTYISFWHPINLEMEDQELDLRVQIFETLKNLNGKKASMDYGMNDLTIHADDESEYEMKFECSNDTPELGENDTVGAILSKTGEGWGMSNVMAYLPDNLQRLNGMRIIVDVDKGHISFKHDETEKVHEMKYTHSNSCHIPDEDVKSICQIGKEDCCIFCTVGGDGFSCEKFGSMASYLLTRHAEGSMRASRIGNCKIVGRIEEKVEN